MKYYVAVTTDAFYFQLRDDNPKQPINFWRPTTRAFRALAPGDLFLFKLHSPRDYVVGGGTFSEFRIHTAAQAWKEFGSRNGARSETELIERLGELRDRHNMGRAAEFGCIILERPFFWRDTDWVPIHDYCQWMPSIVQGKTFDTNTNGAQLWEAVNKRLQK